MYHVHNLFTIHLQTIQKQKTVTLYISRGSNIDQEGGDPIKYIVMCTARAGGYDTITAPYSGTEHSDRDQARKEFAGINRTIRERLGIDAAWIEEIEDPKT